MGNDYSIEFIAETVHVNQFVLNYIETVIYLPVFSFRVFFIFGVFFSGDGEGRGLAHLVTICLANEPINS